MFQAALLIQPFSEACLSGDLSKSVNIKKGLKGRQALQSSISCLLNFSDTPHSIPYLPPSKLFVYLFVSLVCWFLFACLFLFFVSLSVPSFWPNLWVDFSEIWHDDSLFAQLETWAKKIQKKLLP